MSENTRKPVMNMLWPILGGDHTDADTWHEIDAALTTYGDEHYQAAIADVVAMIGEQFNAPHIIDAGRKIANEITRRFGKGQDCDDMGITIADTAKIVAGRVMQWQPISTAPRKTKIIVSDGVDSYALGYLAIIRWYLGDYPNKWRQSLGFKPCWWMPANAKCNPLKVPFPTDLA